jgi:hypothetical protein
MEADSSEEIESGGIANADDFYVTGKTFSPNTMPNSNNYAVAYTGVTVNNIDSLTETITANITIVPNPNPLTKIHVSEISMKLNIKGSNVSATATVTIVDSNSNTISGATVSGKWSVATSDSDSGITDGNGKVSLQSNVLRNPQTGTKFIFTITGVAKNGMEYDPSANAYPSGYITYPQAAPMLVKEYATGLDNPYPSPGNPEIWIPFTLSDTKHVVIRIYSPSGLLVKTLDLGQKPSGAYISKGKTAYWDGTNEKGEKISSGIYFCIMEAGDFTATKKMIIQK